MPLTFDMCLGPSLEIKLVIDNSGIFDFDGSQSLLELFQAHLLTHPFLDRAICSCLGWYEDRRQYLNDSISSNAVLHGDRSEAVDLDRDESSVTCHINTERLLTQQCWKIYVEIALRNALCSTFGLVERVRVKRIVRNDMILEKLG